MHPYTRRPTRGAQRGSSSAEYALLVTFLAVITVVMAFAMTRVVNFELPPVPDTIQSPSEE